MATEFPGERLISQHLHAAADAAARCAEEALESKTYGLIRYFGRMSKNLSILAAASDPSALELGLALPSPWRDQKGSAHVATEDVEDVSGAIWPSLCALGEVLRRDAWFDENPLLAVVDLQACLWVADGRAVGVLFYREDEERFRWFRDMEQMATGAAPICGDSSATLRIVGVWVAKEYRGRGIAKSLAMAAGEAHGLDPRRFLHSPPFTPEGHGFALSLSGEGIRVPAERQDTSHTTADT